MDAPPLARLSLNQATTDRWTLREAVEGCARQGIGWIGPWRHRVAEAGGREGARLIRDAGLRVSSLCRGGWFPAATAEERRARIDDNRRAVEEAAELGTDVLVLVCGPAPDRDLPAAREMVAEGVAATLEHAAACSVRLAVEPLHPMFAGDRSVIVTLAQALDLAERFPAERCGVIVDAYHVWWDPAVEAQIARAAGRILGYHVSDWLVPTPDLLLGRGLMGDGVIDLRRLRGLVEAAGYSGPVEVEIFNRELWDRPGDEVLALVKERFQAVV
ncbi:MAG TPA: sugar phosphate isomerase/epimerase family protein [Candidatus Dormibacteraeota bacterium]|nr:sugar phosphate isomerase/epimerase family protein [Candidatus Dormibacteraeota bacterium]